MKVCIKENEFNWNYHEVYGEDKTIADGYKIFEVPQGYEDCIFEDFNENGFSVELYNKRKTHYQHQQTVLELKQKLKETDYQAIKYAEGEIAEEEYTPIKVQRKEWRDKINRLQEELKNGNNG